MVYPTPTMYKLWHIRDLLDELDELEEEYESSEEPEKPAKPCLAWGKVTIVHKKR